jgi:hypothetical protein
LDNASGFLRGMTTTLFVVALAFSGVLLAEDAGMNLVPQMPRGVISAMSLLLVGVAILILQMMTRPRSKELLKNTLLAATFILWGIVQLMPWNVLSIETGPPCGRGLRSGPFLGDSGCSESQGATCAFVTAMSRELLRIEDCLTFGRLWLRETGIRWANFS